MVGNGVDHGSQITTVMYFNVHTIVSGYMYIIVHIIVSGYKLLPEDVYGDSKNYKDS